MKYVYPAILESVPEGYFVTFPDLPQVRTQGSSLNDALDMAQDVLNLWLWDAEDAGEAIPQASMQATLTLPSNGMVSLIQADTLEYRKKHDTKAVRKNISIPRWLDTLAKAHNVNFSNVLQNALMTELHVN